MGKPYFNSDLNEDSKEDSSRFENDGKEAIAKLIDGLTAGQKEDVLKGVSLAFEESNKNDKNDEDLKKEIQSKNNTNSKVVNSMISPSELGRRDALGRKTGRPFLVCP